VECDPQFGVEKRCPTVPALQRKQTWRKRELVYRYDMPDVRAEPVGKGFL